MSESDRDWLPTSRLAASNRGPASCRAAYFLLVMYGLRIDERGVELLFHGRTQHYRWVQVGEAASTRFGLRLKVGDRTVQVVRDGPWYDQVLERLAQYREPAAEAVAPEDVASWLAIGLDDSLTVPLPRWRGGSPGELLWFMVLVMLLQWRHGTAWRDVMLLWGGSWLTYTAVLAVFRWERWRQLQVTPYGLHHGPRAIRWSDVIDVVTRERGWELRTQGRSFHLAAGDAAERLVAAVRRLSAARRQGAELPRMDDIPDAALSRAESVDVSAERGLSRTE